MSVDLTGTWRATSDVINVLVLRSDGSCLVDGTPARWQAVGDEIWLFDSNNRIGTKWKFSFEGNDTLFFSRPEDFKYLGGTSYIYFQMIDPGAIIRFDREK
ncbi:MAG: hypothetical protein Q6373_023065 [Candidatus Sigynarchaeota archaeon]